MNTTDSVHIFWDNSNIFIPAQSVSADKDGAYAVSRLRIHFENLFRLAHAGRRVASAKCVGSGAPAVWQRLSALGLSSEFFERGGASGREQGVDQCLQVHMLRAAADAATPGVAVLLTGDGAGYEEGRGYHADIERLHRQGWGVEVLSWQGACSRALREWASEVGVFVPLDSYFQSITFVEGGRVALPISLVHRHRAKPVRGAA